MKKIGLIVAVIVVVSLASISASAKNINISMDGACDAMELTMTGTPRIYLDGVHDYSGCNLPNVLVGGFAHTIPTFGSAVLDLMDPTYGYIEGLPYGLEFISNADTKKPCVWAFYLNSPAGYDVLVNSGTCTYFKDAAERPDVKGLPPSYKPAQK
jgi:hypothetical protein